MVMRVSNLTRAVVIETIAITKRKIDESFTQRHVARRRCRRGRSGATAIERMAPPSVVTSTEPTTSANDAASHGHRQRRPPARTGRRRHRASHRTALARRRGHHVRSGRSEPAMTADLSEVGSSDTTRANPTRKVRTPHTYMQVTALRLRHEQSVGANRCRKLPTFPDNIGGGDLRAPPLERDSKPSPPPDSLGQDAQRSTPLVVSLPDRGGGSNRRQHGLGIDVRRSEITRHNPPYEPSRSRYTNRKGRGGKTLGVLRGRGHPKELGAWRHDVSTYRLPVGMLLTPTSLAAPLPTLLASGRRQYRDGILLLSWRGCVSSEGVADEPPVVTLSVRSRGSRSLRRRRCWGWVFGRR